MLFKHLYIIFIIINLNPHLLIIVIILIIDQRDSDRRMTHIPHTILASDKSVSSQIVVY